LFVLALIQLVLGFALIIVVAFVFVFVLVLFVFDSNSDFRLMKQGVTTVFRELAVRNGLNSIA
jgi:hypothetical protein